jgi:transposase
MGKPLSTDLRSRLIAAVAGGMSRRAAAERFGVAAASATRWVHTHNTTGAICAKPQGGDKRSHRIDDLWDVIRDVLTLFKPHECANYFTAAGYEPE